MDIKEKVTLALQQRLQPEHLELEEDGGISGVVVSAEFQRMSALDRQTLISSALRNAPSKLTKAELRHVLAIAALTPAEYAALGSNHNGR
jgi:acid stress-induced BolA-like protein IbaG/YrbA